MDIPTYVNVINILTNNNGTSDHPNFIINYNSLKDSLSSAGLMLVVPDH